MESHSPLACAGEYWYFKTGTTTYQKGPRSTGFSARGPARLDPRPAKLGTEAGQTETEAGSVRGLGMPSPAVC